MKMNFFCEFLLFVIACTFIVTQWTLSCLRSTIIYAYHYLKIRFENNGKVNIFGYKIFVLSNNIDVHRIFAPGQSHTSVKSQNCVRLDEGRVIRDRVLPVAMATRVCTFE